MGILVCFIIFPAKCFALYDKKHGPIRRRNTYICPATFSIMTKMPLFFQLNMLWPVALFEQTVHTFKYNEVFILVKAIVPFSSLDRIGINEFLGREINSERTRKLREIFLQTLFHAA